MKLRKLVMCLLVGIVLFGYAGVDAFAEEAVNTTVATNTTASSNSAASTTATDATTTDATVATIEETTKDTNIDATTEVKDTVSEENSAEVKESAEETKKDTTEEKKNTKKKKTAKKYSEADVRLLSSLIFCEAGGESYSGKLAVAIVVMNRKESSRFPNSVKSVIYQRSQFGPARNGSLSATLRQYDAGKFTSASEKACIKAAKAALSGTKKITVNGKEKNFSKYLYFSGRLSNATYKLGNHQFK